MNKRNVISNILLISSILFLGFILIVTLNQKEGKVTYLFGYKPFIITTGSMEPTYPVNTLVIVKKAEPDSIEIGEPIAFYSPIFDSFVFHRVVDITDEGFVTKGDFNEFMDSDRVQFEHLIGRSVFHTTLSVPVIKILGNPILFASYILGPILILSLIILTFKRYKKGAVE